MGNEDTAKTVDGPERFQHFSRDEMIWVVLALAWARGCVHGDSPTLVFMFHDAAAALKSTDES